MTERSNIVTLTTRDEMTARTRGEPGALTVEKACAMLAAATRIDEVKKIRDVATAMKAYARTQKAGKAGVIDIGEILLRADARMGALAKELTKVPDGKRRGLSDPDVREQKTTALAAVDISTQRASECERVADLSPEDFDQFVKSERKADRAPSRQRALALARLSDADRKRVLAKVADNPDVSRAMREVKAENKAKNEPEFHILLAILDLKQAIQATIDKSTKHWPRKSMRAIPQLLSDMAKDLEKELAC